MTRSTDAMQRRLFKCETAIERLPLSAEQVAAINALADREIERVAALGVDAIDKLIGALPTRKRGPTIDDLIKTELYAVARRSAVQAAGVAA